jgi:hypothetical protein
MGSHKLDKPLEDLFLGTVQGAIGVVVVGFNVPLVEDAREHKLGQLNLQKLKWEFKWPMAHLNSKSRLIYWRNRNFQKL